MSASTLAALMLFTATVTTYRARVIPDVRVFVGVQPGEGDAYAWTKCVPESHIFAVQVAAKTLDMGDEKVRFAAAHEVCHLMLHRSLFCEAGTIWPPRRDIEAEADKCAVELMASDAKEN